MFLSSIVVIEKAQKRLYAYYTNKQFIRPEHDWPPYHFKYFTPLAIIYENIHTNPTIATSMAYISEDHANKTTEDIKSLFSAYRGCGSYKILIEGEPGIGKTILSSEIAAQWADKALLDDKALLFLLFMRQPETKNISNVKSLVEHFFHDNISLVDELTEWLVDSNGRHLTIVLDGYDEASTYSAFYDFVNQLILHKTLPECGLVITSRPAESSHLHSHVNCRAEILGFTEQSRQQFINLYVKKQEKEKQIFQTNQLDIINNNTKKKLEIIQRVLKYNPIINTLCYTPLNATMLLLCLTESDEEIDLPTTATNLYERFIIITIKRFLYSKRFTNALLSFKDLPNEYYQTFQQLSSLAYSASIAVDSKKSMQLVFEIAEIESSCKNFALHGNGLGLLKPACFINMGIQNKYSSYNFLHKSIQEYLAAYHIASLPPKNLSNLLNKRFWDSSCFNVWLMYVGITRGESKEFKHFLSGAPFKFLTPKISSKILNDGIKCLHLLRCAAEAKGSTFLMSVQSMFADKVIDLSNKTLLETDIKTLAVLLLDLPDGPWILNVSNCNINNESCKMLFEIFTSQTVTANVQVVNISFNDIYSENLLKMCQDIFMSWKTEEIILSIDSLHNSATIRAVKQFVYTLEDLIQIHQTSSGKLMVSYQANLAMIIVVYSDLKYVKSFQLHNCELSEDTAKRLNRLVAEELKSYRVGQIYFSHSIYKHHDVETLSYVTENFQRIKFCGLNMHSKGAYILKIASEIDFQVENDLSTLIVDYLAGVLQSNAQASTSSYLTMLPEKVKEKTEANLQTISTIKILDLTNINLLDFIADDIELILSHNELEEMYLEGNNLQSTGIVQILLVSASITTLKVLNISDNNVNIEAAHEIGCVISRQIKLETLILGGNNLQDGLIVIFKKLNHFSTLKILDISNNNACTTTIDKIAAILCFHDRLEKLYLGGNNLVSTETLQALQCCLGLTAFDIKCCDDNSPVVSEHVAHIQMLFYTHNTDISKEYDICKLPLPAEKLNDKEKILRSAGKY